MEATCLAGNVAVDDASLLSTRPEACKGLRKKEKSQI